MTLPTLHAIVAAAADEAARYVAENYVAKRLAPGADADEQPEDDEPIAYGVTAGGS